MEMSGAVSFGVAATGAAAYMAIVGILLWNAFPTRLYEQLQLDLLPTQTAAATISSVESTGLSSGGGGSAGRSKVFKVKYSLVVPNRNGVFFGESFLRQSTVNRKGWVKPGTTVGIRYVVANPSISCMVGGGLLPFGYFGLLLVLVPIVVAILILRHAWARRRAADLVAHGEYAVGVISQIVPLKHLLPRSKRGQLHSVEVRFQEGSQAAEFQFAAREDEMPFLRESFDAGKPLRLIYDSADPKRVLVIGLHLSDALA
jgi:hypothetical protein